MTSEPPLCGFNGIFLYLYVPQVDGDYLIVKDRQYRLSKNVYVVAFGKAVGGMVRATQELLGDHIVRGVASVPVGLEEFAKATNKE